MTGEQWLADIIYFPRQTQLMQMAKARGIRVIGGGAMAIHQAARAFEIFTATPPTRTAWCKRWMRTVPLEGVQEKIRPAPPNAALHFESHQFE